MSWPGPSPWCQLPQNASHVAEMLLPWLHFPGEAACTPQNPVHVTHRMSGPAVSYLPLHLCWVQEDRPTLPQVEPLPVPALCHQLASVPSLSSPSKGMCHPVPHSKKEAAVTRLFREGVLGLGVVLRRCL